MATVLLLIAALMQGFAVAYAIFLLSRRQGATGAWVFLLGAMVSMLVWRIVVMLAIVPPSFFNPLIGIWGSTCMVGAMFLFGREVAERRRVESERDALLEGERLARADAEAANRSKDDFLATLSHELRTPLASILSWCEICKSPRSQAQDRERALVTIERNARAQARLIDDLLDATRMQAGKLHLDFDRVDLSGPVQAAVQAVMPAAQEKSIRLEWRSVSPAPVVLGDADRLQQVVTNLLVNAVKFTPRNGRVDVDLATDPESGNARLTVADTGEGIAPEFIAHLFGRFRQADSSASRRHGGLGLGLSIVDFIVRGHGGDVVARSEGIGHGASFIVSLPLSPAGAGVAGDAAGTGTEPVALGRQPLSGLRIVVVDDQDDVRAALTQLLQQRGADVTALPSGDTVEAVLRERRPHLLLLDIGMPDEDGYMLIRRIRNLPGASGGATPAISLTAHARNEDRERALDAGFQQHMPKPIDIVALTEAILQTAEPPRVPMECD